MKGILFKAEMVRAILEGRKTVTRRVMKPQPDSDHPWKCIPSYRMECALMRCVDGLSVKFWHRIDENPEADGVQWIKAPYRPGEVVYVKEGWAYATDFGYDTDHVFYRASYINGGPYDDVKKWQSPLFLKEQDARIHLEIVSVRPERVQEITEEEAAREGTQEWYPDIHKPNRAPYSTNRDRFIDLWDSIHPGSWDQNPWVWRVEFRVMGK